MEKTYEKNLKNLNRTLLQVQNCKFYRERISKTKLNSLEELKMLPFTSSNDLCEYGHQMLCVSQSEVLRVVTLPTSGSSGNPKRIFFTSEDLELTINFFQKGLRRLNGSNMLILMPCNRKYSVGDLIVRGIIKDKVNPIPYGTVKTFNSLISDFKVADSVVSPPIPLLAFGKYLKHFGLLKKLNGILVSSDYLPSIVVKKLSELFSCDVFNHYGLTESGLGGAVECSEHIGMHIRDEDLYFEVIDPVTKEILPNGIEGEIVFTTLTRKAMPLIRYRTGDIGCILPYKCPCGNPQKLLGNLKGRILDTKMGISLAQLDELLFSLDSIIDYKVTIISDSHVHFDILCFYWNIPKHDEIIYILNKIPFFSNGKITISKIVECDWKNLFKGKRRIIDLWYDNNI